MSDSPIAFRGSSSMAAPELRAHLAVTARTQNVGVLLGAGASVNVGCPTMAGLWKRIGEDHAQTPLWLDENGFLTEGDPGSPNLEHVIDRLAVAEQDAARRDINSAELKEIKHHKSTIVKTLLESCLIDRAFWDGRLSPLNDDRFSSHRKLLTRLITSRSPGQHAPWVFTTNYDLSVEWAAEGLGIDVTNGFGGLHDRRFSSSRFEQSVRNVRGTGQGKLSSRHLYYAKLHGSLSWLQQPDRLLRELNAHHMWTVLEPALDEASEQASDLVLILPSTQKFVATASHVYGELIRRFTEFLGSEQTTLLVSGYSFCDEHLNRLFGAAINNPTIQLVICLPEMTIEENNRFEGLSQPARALIEPLVTAASPRVTFVCGEAAYFDNFVKLLPEPALFDEIGAQGERIERSIEKSTTENS